MDFYDAISKELSFEEVVRSSNQESNYFYCDIHGDEETPDLKIYSEGNWKCYSCGSKGGDIVNYVAQRDGINNLEAAKQLVQKYNLEVSLELTEEEKNRLEERKRVRKVQETALRKAEKERNESFIQLLKERRNWSKETIEDLRIGKFTEKVFNELKQEFSQELIEKSGIHYGMTGTGGYTVLIPHLKSNDEPYLITCRDPFAEEEHKKYMQSKNTEFIENEIYKILKNKSNTLIITEGYPDLISAYEEGYDGISAGCGSFEGNEERILDKARNYDQIFVISDNDETGRTNRDEIAEFLARKEVNVQIHSWPDDTEGKYDLDDFLTEKPGQLDNLIENSQNYVEFVIEQLENTENTKYEKKSELKEKIFDIIEKWPQRKRNPIFNELPGNKRDLRKEFDEWCEEKVENHDLEFESSFIEDDSIREPIEIEDIKLNLNPVTGLRIIELEETVRDIKQSGNEAVKPEPRFNVYRFSFGKGANEEEYKLYTPPHVVLNSGDKYLPLRKLDLSNQDYIDHLKEQYKGKDIDMSFNNWVKSKSEEIFQLSDELDKESKEKLKDLDNNQIKSIVLEYLRNGFQYDSTLEWLMFPKIVTHDKKMAEPEDVMSYSPHAMFFTNSKVGKTFISERVGERRDDVSTAGLLGYVSDDGPKMGVLDGLEENIFADEINFGSQKGLNDTLLTILETGSETQSKAGEDLKTEFYGSLTYMANPIKEDNFEEMAERFERLIEGLGNNTKAMGSRFGVILYNKNLDNVKGSQLDKNKRKKLSTVVNWIKREVKTEYSRIEKKNREWLNKEFPENYQENIDNLRKDSTPKLNEFLQNHKNSYRHARGMALRMAVFENIGDVLNREYDESKIVQDAEDSFSELMEINLDSIGRITSTLSNEERISKIKENTLESQSPDYLKYFLKALLAYSSQNKIPEQYMPIKSLNETWNEIKYDLEVDQNSKYWKWSNIESKIKKNKHDKSDILEKRYGVWLATKQDITMTRVKEKDVFKQYRNAIDLTSDQGNQGDYIKTENASDVRV